jgi:predicted nucleotidyltransferase
MNSLIQQQLQANRQALETICQRLDVRRLRVFGSAVGDSFIAKSSDLDLIVDFYNDSAAGIADRFLTLAEELESLFQRRVDLLTERSVRNPIFRASIEEAGQTVYEH